MTIGDRRMTELSESIEIGTSLLALAQMSRTREVYS